MESYQTLKFPRLDFTAILYFIPDLGIVGGRWVFSLFPEISECCNFLIFFFLNVSESVASVPHGAALAASCNLCFESNISLPFLVGIQQSEPPLPGFSVFALLLTSHSAAIRCWAALCIAKVTTKILTLLKSVLVVGIIQSCQNCWP